MLLLCLVSCFQFAFVMHKQDGHADRGAATWTAANNQLCLWRCPTHDLIHTWKGSWAHATPKTAISLIHCTVSSASCELTLCQLVSDAGVFGIFVELYHMCRFNDHFLFYFGSPLHCILFLPATQRCLDTANDIWPHLHMNNPVEAI